MDACSNLRQRCGGTTRLQCDPALARVSNQQINRNQTVCPVVPPALWFREGISVQHFTEMFFQARRVLLKKALLPQNLTNVFESERVQTDNSSWHIPGDIPAHSLCVSGHLCRKLCWLHDFFFPPLPPFLFPDTRSSGWAVNLKHWQCSSLIAHFRNGLYSFAWTSPHPSRARHSSSSVGLRLKAAPSWQ